MELEKRILSPSRARHFMVKIPRVNKRYRNAVIREKLKEVYPFVKDTSVIFEKKIGDNSICVIDDEPFEPGISPVFLLSDYMKNGGGIYVGKSEVIFLKKSGRNLCDLNVMDRKGNPEDMMKAISEFKDVKTVVLVETASDRNLVMTLHDKKIVKVKNISKKRNPFSTFSLLSRCFFA